MASRQIVTDAQEGFAGGYNGAGTQTLIAANQFGAMQNVRVVRSCELAKRPGMRLLASPSRGQSIAAWYRSGSLAEIVVIGDDSHLRYGTFDPVLGTVPLTDKGVVSKASLTGYAQFRDATQDVLYLADGLSLPSKFTSAHVYSTLAAPAPAATALWTYNQRLFASFAGANTIYWSGLNNGDTLGDTANGGGSARINTFGDSIIFGGLVVGGTNYIMHHGGISAFTGRTFDDIQIQAGLTGALTGLGAIGTGAFATIDGIGYVVTMRGLYLLTPDGNIQPYQQPNRPDPINDLDWWRTSPRSARIVNNARANEIWFILSNTNDAASPPNYTTVLIYNKSLGVFSGQCVFASGVWGNGSPIDGVGTADGPGKPQMVLVALGQLVGCDFSHTELEVFQDVAFNYTSLATCRRFYTSALQSTKAFRRAVVAMGAGQLGTATAGSTTGATLTYSTPVGGVVADATDLSAATTSIVQAGGQGPYMDVTITDSGASSVGWSVERVDVEAFDYGIRGR